MQKVVVVGGAGHVGLPFAITLANSKKFESVTGIDLDTAKCHVLNGGQMIYEEVGGEAALKEAVEKNGLEFTADGNDEALKNADVIAIMIGTPVDSENNPRLDDLFDYLDKKLLPTVYWRYASGKETLILLRSTVSPGTTDRVNNIILKYLISRTGNGTMLDYHKRVHLVFAPERVAQGYGLIETPQFPQIVGANDRPAWLAAQAFFHKFTDEEPILLSTVEAELAKLMTNMTRYVNFALANEFYMIGSTFSKRFNKNVNIDKIIDACNKKYPRMNLPKPGPNVGGPCLFKDGRFLTTGVPFADLINTSFLINEGFPAFIMDLIRERIKLDYFDAKTVGILGATFKKDNDDIRNSLSFKMAKITREAGYDTIMHDPFWKPARGDRRNQSFQAIMRASDIIIIMTPHTKFVEELNKRLSTHIPAGSNVKNALIVDIWKCLDLSKNTDDGIFYGVYKDNG